MSDDSVVRISAAPAASAKRKPALGRGLGALLGDVRREEPVASRSGQDGDGSPIQGLATLAVADIEPHPDQPRRHFDVPIVT